MMLSRRLGAILIAWIMVFSASVALASETSEYFGASDADDLRYAPEGSASVSHEHGGTDRSEDCHPGMACSISAIGTQHEKLIWTQRCSGVKWITVARASDRFIPVSDPPPPRLAV
jgi:hypothetical protein